MLVRRANATRQPSWESHLSDQAGRLAIQLIQAHACPSPPVFGQADYHIVDRILFSATRCRFGKYLLRLVRGLDAGLTPPEHFQAYRRVALFQWAWLDGMLADVGDGLRDLDGRLEPFLNAMGRKTRREWAPFYVRGLLGPGEHKSLQPMAARLGLLGHDQLQRFVASTAWDDGPLWTVLAQAADRLVGGPGGCLVIDDIALPKRGTLSVGAARQYCRQLDEQANCPSLVSPCLAHGEIPVPVSLRLSPPNE